uniref:C2H2-type domain-containing protein n=1 Tax=Photinus pyralis TaxID=7054 RepID=A0A1Y1MF51_PHOPY
MSSTVGEGELIKVEPKEEEEIHTFMDEMVCVNSTNPSLVQEGNIGTEIGSNKAYFCFHCNYATTTKSYLKKHVTRHSASKNFKCDQCDYTACRKAYLKAHVLIHDKSTPFKCEQCDYVTNGKYYFK